jgi:hypothetical protein
MSKVFLVVGAIVAALLFQTVGNPYLAAYQLKSAVENQDAERVVSMIDFESVRAGMKEDVTANLAAQGDQMALALGGALVESFIDSFVQPDSIEAMLADSYYTSGLTGGADAETAISTKLGFLKLTITVQGDTGPTDIILGPKGVKWKVVRIKTDLSQL